MKPHTFNLNIVVFFALVLCAVVTVSAVPNTAAVSDQTANSVTFHGTGCAGTCRFLWGYQDNYYWSTPNQTAVGNFEDIQFSSPMLTGETYNVKACDETGCDTTPVSFVVPDATPINATRYGVNALSIWRSGFNITEIGTKLLSPYVGSMVDLGQSDTSAATGIVWGVFFSFLFFGYWLRGRGVLLPSILAMIAGFFIIANSVAGMAGTNIIQVAPVFVAAGIPLMIIGLAGVFVSIGTK